MVQRIFIYSYLESKVKDEIIDILGFLAYEIVSVLTERGLAIKKEWERLDPQSELNAGGSASDRSSHRQQMAMEGYLFAKPPAHQTPLQPRHIREAFRQSQCVDYAMQNFTGYFAKKSLSFI